MQLLELLIEERQNSARQKDYIEELTSRILEKDPSKNHLHS
jgi:hypothetical protein